MFSYLLIGLATNAMPSARLDLQSSPPNIIVIMTDDFGYSDVSFNGSSRIPTPNIDGIAERGIKFENGYVTAPLCAPSRAGLLTGKSGTTFGFTTNPNLRDPDWRTKCHLPTDQLTLAEYLKPAGYATGVIGKWHLGFSDGYLPNDRGFDYYFGFLEQSTDYLVTSTPTYPYWENKTQTLLTEYQTDEFADRAVQFVDQHAGSPFLLYLPFGAAHTPLQSIHKYLVRFPQYTDEEQKYCSMISAVDDAVGKVVYELKKRALLNNTMIVFLTDNGGREDLAADNAPLNGTKNCFNEGGIRVPFALSWPRRLPQGISYAPMVTAADIVPTALAAAKIPQPAGLTGVNLIPYFTNQLPDTSVPHQYLYWMSPQGGAIRHGNFKWVHAYNDQNVMTEGLYDLSADVSESTDLTALMPSIAKDLSARWWHWKALLPARLW
jgi:arylsulfatase A-like enzyme